MLCLLPGSRKGEIARHVPIFSRTIAQLAEKFPTLTIVVPIASHLAKAVKHAAEKWTLRTLIIEGEKQKKDAFAGSDVALAKSGTVTLELAMAGVPMVMTYRMNPLSAALLRRLVKIPYITIINLILRREVIPEFLQEKCRADLLAPAFQHLLEDEPARQEQITQMRRALLQLGAEDTISPSDKAAKVVMEIISR